MRSGMLELWGTHEMKSPNAGKQDRFDGAYGGATNGKGMPNKEVAWKVAERVGRMDVDEHERDNVASKHH